MNMRRIRFALNWMGTAVFWAGVLSCGQAPEGTWALDRAATMVEEGDCFQLSVRGPAPRGLVWSSDHAAVAQDQSFSGRIAGLDVPKGKGEWETLECEVDGVKEGPHALWFLFSGEDGGRKSSVDLFEIDWFRFE